MWRKNGSKKGAPPEDDWVPLFNGVNLDGWVVHGTTEHLFAVENGEIHVYPTQTDLHADAWGAQAGLMLTLGPVMVGGAGFTGAGLSPITHVDEHQTAVDVTGTLRESRGIFGLGAAPPLTTQIR
jgi:hypothetical protein